MAPVNSETDQQLPQYIELCYDLDGYSDPQMTMNIPVEWTKSGKRILWGVAENNPCFKVTIKINETKNDCDKFRQIGLELLNSLLKRH